MYKVQNIPRKNKFIVYFVIPIYIMFSRHLTVIRFRLNFFCLKSFQLHKLYYYFICLTIPILFLQGIWYSCAIVCNTLTCLFRFLAFLLVAHLQLAFSLAAISICTHFVCCCWCCICCCCCWQQWVISCCCCYCFCLTENLFMVCAPTRMWP